MTRYQMSEQALNLLKQVEELRLTVYDDQTGKEGRYTTVGRDELWLSHYPRLFDSQTDQIYGDVFADLGRGGGERGNGESGKRNIKSFDVITMRIVQKQVGVCK